jgi:hypothetical protein
MFVLLWFSLCQVWASDDIKLLQKWSKEKPSSEELWIEGHKLALDYWKKMNYPKSLHPDIPEIKEQLKMGLEKNYASGSSMQNHIIMFAGAWIEKTYADITSYPLPKFRPAESDFSITNVVNSRFFTVVPDDIQISKEISTSMLKNGRVNAGEMIVLRVPLKNIYSRPLFSTSAFVSSSSSYSWSLTKKEIEIQELKPSQVAYIDVPLYISRSTPNGTMVPIKIKLYDSKYFSTNPIQVQFSIKISNLGHPTLYRTLVERDMPGFSEKNNSSEILAKQRVEVRTDILIQDKRVSGVLLDYQYDSLLSGTYVATEMTKRNSSSTIVFESNDDLDFEIQSETDYQQLRDKSLQKYPWQEQPTTYIAVDSLYYYQTKKKSTEVKEIVEYSPVKYDVIKRISQESLELKSLRPASGVPSNALDATIGYYVQFDDETFQKLYENAVSNSKKITKEEVTIEEVKKAPLYRSRHYIEIPLKAAEKKIVYGCSIYAKKEVILGNMVSFRLYSENLPDGSLADVFVDGSKLKTMSPTDDPIFIDTPLSVGSHKITVVINDKTENEICSSSSLIQVREKVQPQKTVSKKTVPMESEESDLGYTKIFRLGGGISIVDYRYYGSGTIQLNGTGPFTPHVQLQLGSESGFFIGANGRIKLLDEISSLNLYTGFMLSNIDGPVKMKLGVRPEFALLGREQKLLWLDIGSSISSYGAGFSLMGGLGWIY